MTLCMLNVHDTAYSTEVCECLCEIEKCVCLPSIQANLPIFYPTPKLPPSSSAHFPLPLLLLNTSLMLLKLPPLIPFFLLITLSALLCRVPFPSFPSVAHHSLLCSATMATVH